MPMAGRPPASSRSVSAALDALILDESWQGNLTDDERALLVEWAERCLSDSLVQTLLLVRARLRACNSAMQPPAGEAGRRKILKAILQESP